MSETLVCVGCLVTEARMVNMNSYGLTEPYQLLTGLQASDINPSKPPDRLCWECAGLVNKFNTFRLKCERAHTLLRVAYVVHGNVNKKNLKEIDREKFHLNSKISTTETLIVDYHPSKKAVEENKENDDLKLDIPEVPISDEVESKTLKDENIENELNYEWDVKFENWDADNVDFDNDFDVKNEELPIKKESKTKKKKSKKKLEKAKKEKFKKKETKKKKKVKSVPKDRKKIDFSSYAIEIKYTQEEQMEEILKRQETKNYTDSPFKCTYCFKGYIAETTFKNHMKKHDPESGKFECDFCKTRHQTKRAIKCHMQCTHLSKYQCILCPFVSRTTSQAMAHHDSHKGIIHTCKICGEKFNNRSTHQNHLRKKHSSRHICVLCGESFVSETGLTFHRSYIHQDAPIPQNLDPEAYCKECNIYFASKDILMRHMLISKNHTDIDAGMIICRICGLQFDTLTLRSLHIAKEHPTVKLFEKRVPSKRSAAAPSSYPSKCVQCDQIVRNGYDYRRHFREEHPDMVYPKEYQVVCEVCGRGFNCNAQLKIHMVRHTGERPYACPLCPKSFYDLQGLRKHKRCRHSDERPFACELCGSTFRFRQGLKKHIRVHTGEKPYTCDICGKAFSDSTYRNVHKRTVHFKETIPFLMRKRNKNKLKREHEVEFDFDT